MKLSSSSMPVVGVHAGPKGPFKLWTSDLLDEAYSSDKRLIKSFKKGGLASCLWKGGSPVGDSFHERVSWRCAELTKQTPRSSLLCGCSTAEGVRTES